MFGSIVIATNVLGSYALKRGLENIGIVESVSPVPYIQSFAEPWVAAGVLLMICWLGSRLALLSWADLTYVAPLASISYVLAPVVGSVFLHEPISSSHWAGILCISMGAIFVALTFPNTTESENCSI